MQDICEMHSPFTSQDRALCVIMTAIALLLFAALQWSVSEFIVICTLSDWGFSLSPDFLMSLWSTAKSADRRSSSPLSCMGCHLKFQSLKTAAEANNQRGIVSQWHPDDNRMQRKEVCLWHACAICGMPSAQALLWLEHNSWWGNDTYSTATASHVHR